MTKTKEKKSKKETKRETNRVLNLFQTPIYEEIYEGENLDLVQEEIKQAIEETEFLERDQSTLGHLICKNEFNTDWISDKKLPKFESMLNEGLSRYCQTIGVDPDGVAFTRESWINKFEKNSFSHIHEHGQSHISGVYYYQTTGYDGNIFFETPVAQSKCSKIWQQMPSRIYRPSCKGSVILFPGWLRHGVSENFTDDTRISISFNINLVGDWKPLSPCERRKSN